MPSHRLILVVALLLAQGPADPSGHWTGAIHVPAYNGASAREIAGEFITTAGGYAIPFNLARTGEAQLTATPKSAAIAQELKGTWNGTVEFEGKKERLVLKLANRADGSAAGTILDLDGSNVEIPIGMTQKAASVTIEVAAVSASFTGVLNGSELTGTWNQGPLTLPLTFTRAAK